MIDLGKLYQEIEALSLDEFEQLIQFIDKTRKQRAKTILLEAQRQAARLTTETDITITKKSIKSNRPAKYRDPNNYDNTWSGFGRQPDWMKRYLDNGGSRDDLLI